MVPDVLSLNNYPNRYLVLTPGTTRIPGTASNDNMRTPSSSSWWPNLWLSSQPTADSFLNNNNLWFILYWIPFLKERSFVCLRGHKNVG